MPGPGSRQPAMSSFHARDARVIRRIEAKRTTHAAGWHAELRGDPGIPGLPCLQPLDEGVAQVAPQVQVCHVQQPPVEDGGTPGESTVDVLDGVVECHRASLPDRRGDGRHRIHRRRGGLWDDGGMEEPLPRPMAGQAQLAAIGSPEAPQTEGQRQVARVDGTVCSPDCLTRTVEHDVAGILGQGWMAQGGEQPRCQHRAREQQVRRPALRSARSCEKSRKSSGKRSWRPLPTRPATRVAWCLRRPIRSAPEPRCCRAPKAEHLRDATPEVLRKGCGT